MRRDGMRPIRHHMKRWIAVAALAGAVGLVPGTALAASSSDTTGREYGQHVASCAHEMGGFDGAHNPGMHHGFAGWTEQSC
jgi:hypothetical protein